MTDSQPPMQPRCRSKYRAYYVAREKREVFFFLIRKIASAGVNILYGLYSTPVRYQKQKKSKKDREIQLCTTRPFRKGVEGLKGGQSQYRPKCRQRYTDTLWFPYNGMGLSSTVPYMGVAMTRERGGLFYE